MVLMHKIIFPDVILAPQCSLLIISEENKAHKEKKRSIEGEELLMFV